MELMSFTIHTAVPKMKLKQQKYKAFKLFLSIHNHVCPSIAIESAFVWDIRALNEGNEKSLKNNNKYCR